MDAQMDPLERFLARFDPLGAPTPARAATASAHANGHGGVRSGLEQANGGAGLLGAGPSASLSARACAGPNPAYSGPATANGPGAMPRSPSAASLGGLSCGGRSASSAHRPAASALGSAGARSPAGSACGGGAPPSLRGASDEPLGAILRDALPSGLLSIAGVAASLTSAGRAAAERAAAKALAAAQEAAKRGSREEAVHRAHSVSSAHVLTSDYVALTGPLPNGVLLTDTAEGRLRLFKSLACLEPGRTYRTELGHALVRTGAGSATLAGSVELCFEPSADFDWGAKVEALAEARAGDLARAAEGRAGAERDASAAAAAKALVARDARPRAPEHGMGCVDAGPRGGAAAAPESPRPETPEPRTPSPPRSAGPGTPGAQVQSRAGARAADPASGRFTASLRRHNSAEALADEPRPPQPPRARAAGLCGAAEGAGPSGAGSAAQAGRAGDTGWCGSGGAADRGNGCGAPLRANDNGARGGGGPSPRLGPRAPPAGLANGGAGGGGERENLAELERRRALAAEASARAAEAAARAAEEGARAEAARLTRLAQVEARVAEMASWQPADQSAQHAEKRVLSQAAARLGLLEERLLTAEGQLVGLRRENGALLDRLHAAQDAGFLGPPPAR